MNEEELATFLYCPKTPDPIFKILAGEKEDSFILDRSVYIALQTAAVL